MKILVNLKVSIDSTTIDVTLDDLELQPPEQQEQPKQIDWDKALPTYLASDFIKVLKQDYSTTDKLPTK